MLVNTTMAELSDLTFRTAFIIYIVALLMACVYYGRVLAVVDVRRERRAAQQERAAEKVVVGAGGPVVVEKQLPPTLRRNLKPGVLRGLQHLVAGEVLAGDGHGAGLRIDVDGVGAADHLHLINERVHGGLRGRARNAVVLRHRATFTPVDRPKRPAGNCRTPGTVETVCIITNMSQGV